LRHGISITRIKSVWPELDMAAWGAVL
jgi:hypothetical protein